VDEVVRTSDVILSVCPPHAALDVARSVAGFDGLFVDANAVSPATARELAAVVEDGGGRFVDGGIVGGPPPSPGTRLYLSGSDAGAVAELFAGSPLEPCVLGDEIGTASTLKLCYAAWTKGSAALLLAAAEAADRLGVGDALRAEWERSIPELPARLEQARRSARAKGWRWVGEMEEIEATIGSGFHAAAADVYRRS
jgi:3-hydroxyisobutyrate dehydrogenase-like beta-hydroxyacid dehydrogenase